MKINTTNKITRGFTLVELMVVIALIGLLSVIAFASYSSARAKSRDVQRISDMQQLSVELRLFAEKHGRYPSAADGSCSYYNSFGPGGCLQVLVAEGFMNALPVDPKNEAYSGSGATTQMYYYDNLCSGTAASDKQYRAWSNSEINRGATAENWPSDNIIGVTTCSNPS